ncbi:MAG: hypothetical protein IJ915_05725 [Paludibacteraceae bacterium]|nr:hypothetical protein [Paludibacteraceae bacterium]
MKRIILCIVAGLVSATITWAADGLNYDGNTLNLNNDFTRTECGTMAKKVMPETSGFACSRQTSGYIWAHGDENTGSNKKIVAIQPSGTLAMTVTISGDPGRDDWEDIATGIYGGKNYVFIGAIGDNDLQFKDSYYIYFFEEPAITSASKEVSVKYIRFGYPDNKAHNTETLMYDNVEQIFYIVDKVKSGVCTLYSLPFKTDYGTSTQTLTKVCELGSGSKFNYCTGGDISPDGKWMLIKSKPYTLMWERQGSESLSQTAQRLPVQIAAYQEEAQGEAIAWLDSTTFYTTSDQKNDVPIYQYVRTFDNGGGGGTNPPEPPTESSPELYEVIMNNGYNAYLSGDELRAFYTAGEAEPAIKSLKANEGTTWEREGNTVTLTGTDKTTKSYTLVIEAVQPREYTPDEIVFDGSEGSWVKCAYGWDSTKKWRFSKTDDNYERELAGKTHVEFFLPACDTVVLKSMDSNERDMRAYANGVQIGDKVKLLKAGTTLVVKQSAPFMLTVASAQSSGDGGVKALRMARKAGPSQSVRNVHSNPVQSTKVLRDGQLLIERNGVLYDMQGKRL